MFSIASICALRYFLQEYVLVSQEKMQVEVYRPDANGHWSGEISRAGDRLNLNSVGLSLTMADIYDEVLA